VVLAILQAVAILLTIARERKLISAGEQRAIAAHLIRIAHKAEVAGLVHEEISKLSDGDVNERLRKYYRDR
jgi:hypothetical protein